MSRDRLHEQITNRLDQAARRVAESREALDDPTFVHLAAMEILGTCQGDTSTALERVARLAIIRQVQRDQLVAALEEIERRLKAQPLLVRILGTPFAFGNNGDTTRRVYATPAGREFSAIYCVAIQDDQPDPAPLSFAYTDIEGKTLLGPAENIPLLHLEEHPVIRADSESDLPDVGQVVVNHGPDQHIVLLAPREMAEEVQRQLDDGQTVIVRHDQLAVRKIVETSLTATEDWLEFPSLDGPALDELVFPPWLAGEWQRDVRVLIDGGARRVLLLGPTGTGKTEGVLRCGRAAALRSGRKLAIIRISAAHVGSSFYAETERTIGRAHKRAIKLAEQGYVTIVLVDEADALLGNSDNRYEGSVDRRVRLTFQELFCADMPGVGVYLTMNPRPDSWLPVAINQRFRKRPYPRTTRGQLAKVCAGYAEPEGLAQLSLAPEEFGNRVADYMFSGDFVVAKAFLHSGKVRKVRARDLKDCISPGKMKALLMDFFADVHYGDADSLHSLWTRLERECRGVHLNEANLHEITFLPRNPHDKVKAVEPEANRASSARPVVFN